MTRGTSEQQKAFLKLSHELWATNKNLSHRSNRHDSRCARCKRLYENWEHIFTCVSDHSLQFQQKELSTLRLYLQKLRLSQPMITTMLTGLSQWLHQQPPSFPITRPLSHDPHYDLLLSAFTDQSQIGWNHFCRGRLALTWFIAHDFYADDRHLPSQHYSKNLGPKLIRALWNYSLNTWNHRNSYHFGNTIAQQQQYQEQKVNDNIMLYYHQPHLVPSHTHSILYQLPIEELQQKPLTFKKHWIYMHQVFQSHLNAERQEVSLQHHTSANLSHSNHPTSLPQAPNPPYHPIFRLANKLYTASRNLITSHFPIIPRPRPSKSNPSPSPSHTQDSPQDPSPTS